MPSDANDGTEPNFSDGTHHEGPADLLATQSPPAHVRSEVTASCATSTNNNNPSGASLCEGSTDSKLQEENRAFLVRISRIIDCDGVRRYKNCILSVYIVR